MSWRTVKLQDICEIQPPKKEAKDILSDDSEVSFMGMNLLGVDKVYAKPNEVEVLSAVYKAYTYFAENDVLLAKITPCFENGKLGIAQGLKNGIGFGSSEFIVFRCKEVLLPKYLYYFLNQKSFRESGKKNMSGAVGHKRVKKEFIENTLLFLPPILVQRRIVAKLDALFAEIDKMILLKKRSISNLDKLFLNQLNNFFLNNSNNWESTTLGAYYDVRDGTHESPKYVPQGIPLVTSKNLKDGKIDLTKIKYIKNEDYLLIKKRSGVSMGDVLMAMIGTIGNPVIIKNDNHFAIKNVALFKVKEKQSSNFLKYYLDSAFVKNKMMKDSKGTTQQFVGLGYLRNFPIKVPSFEQQQGISLKIISLEKNVDTLKKKYNSILKNYISLKNSLLTELLNKSKAA